MDVIWIKIIIIAVACVIMLLLTGMFFKKTIPIDPHGECGTARQFASLNGLTVLYAILATAALLLARFVNPLAQTIGGIVMAVGLAAEVISFVRAQSSLKKALAHPAEERKEETARIKQMIHILFSARLCSDLFLAFLTLIVWL